jgi:cell division protein ZipA
MQANWSLILNVLLLTGVVIALVRMLRTKKTVEAPRAVAPQQPSVLGGIDKTSDEVIAVRKITREPTLVQTQFAPTPNTAHHRPHVGVPKVETGLQSSYGVVAPPPGLICEPQQTASQLDEPASVDPVNVVEEKSQENIQRTLVIFLLAKENRQLAGYELLQTILAAGLRFGEGQLFHRHQYPNGQGPVLCSLATATASGVFDLQNIGAFSVHGLCLFMQTSGNAAIDTERLSVMIDTAKQLSEGLDTYLLDDKRKAWSDESEARYAECLVNMPESICE